MDAKVSKAIAGKKDRFVLSITCLQGFQRIAVEQYLPKKEARM